MSRAVELLGGGILGFIAGSFLCTPVIAHVFGPTTVTWDASACPSGIYTITSTATSAEDGRSFTAVTDHIRLPQGSIVQEFSDLPAGQYLVTASVRDAHGNAFPSNTQTVTGQGPSRGHQSPPVAPPPQAGYDPPSVGKSAAAPPVLAPPAPDAAPPPPPPPPVVGPSAPQETKAPTASMQLTPAMAKLLIGEADTKAGIEPAVLKSIPPWRRIDLIDADDDGIVDVVRIEFVSGEIWVATSGR